MFFLQNHRKQKGGKDGSKPGPGTRAKMVEIKTQKEMYTDKHRPYVSINNSGLQLHWLIQTRRAPTAFEGQGPETTPRRVFRASFFSSGTQMYTPVHITHTHNWYTYMYWQGAYVFQGLNKAIRLGNIKFSEIHRWWFIGVPTWFLLSCPKPNGLPLQICSTKSSPVVFPTLISWHLITHLQTCCSS